MQKAGSIGGWYFYHFYVLGRAIVLPRTPNATSLGHKDLNFSTLTRFNQIFVVRIWFFSSCIQKRSWCNSLLSVIWRPSYVGSLAGGGNISSDAEWLIPSVAPIRLVIGLLCTVWCQRPNVPKKRRKRSYREEVIWLKRKFLIKTRFENFLKLSRFDFGFLKVQFCVSDW